MAAILDNIGKESNAQSKQHRGSWNLQGSRILKYTTKYYTITTSFEKKIAYHFMWILQYFVWWLLHNLKRKYFQTFTESSASSELFLTPIFVMITS